MPFNLNESIVAYKARHLNYGKLVTVKETAVKELLHLQSEAIRNKVEITPEFSTLKDSVLGAIAEVTPADKTTVTEGLSPERSADLVNKHIRQQKASELLATEALSKAQTTSQDLLASRTIIEELIGTVRKVTENFSKDRDAIKTQSAAVIAEQFKKFEKLLAETLQSADSKLKENMTKQKDLIAIILDEGKKVVTQHRESGKKTKSLLEAAVRIASILKLELKKERAKSASKDDVKYSRTVESKIETRKESLKEGQVNIPSGLM